MPPDLAAAYRFVPGQHLTFRVSRDGEELRRSYSICSGLDDGDLRVAIKHVPGGRFSAWANYELKPGMELDVMTPTGRFTLDPDPPRAASYLAIAAGSGITPIMSLLKSVLAREPRSRFTLFYGNRTVSSILFRETLADLKDRYLERFDLFHVLSGQAVDVPALNGRITPDKLLELSMLLPPLPTFEQVFLCGPKLMADALQPALVAMGMAPHRVRRELFGAEGRPLATVAPSPSTAATRTLTLTLGGVTAEVPLRAGQTLLEAGRAAGLELPFSCTAGVCATCRAHLDEGQVEMAANYALEPWEIERGYILTCQSRPTTEYVTVDFDRP